MYRKHLWILLAIAAMIFSGCDKNEDGSTPELSDSLTNTSWAFKYLHEDCHEVQPRYDKESDTYYDDDCYCTTTLSFHSGGVFSISERHEALSSSDEYEYIGAYGDYVYNAPSGTLKEGLSGFITDVSFTIKGNVLYLISPFNGKQTEYHRVR